MDRPPFDIERGAGEIDVIATQQSAGSAWVLKRSGAARLEFESGAGAPLAVPAGVDQVDLGGPHLAAGLAPSGSGLLILGYDATLDRYVHSLVGSMSGEPGPSGSPVRASSRAGEPGPSGARRRTGARAAARPHRRHLRCLRRGPGHRTGGSSGRRPGRPGRRRGRRGSRQRPDPSLDGRRKRPRVQVVHGGLERHDVVTVSGSSWRDRDRRCHDHESAAPRERGGPRPVRKRRHVRVLRRATKVRTSAPGGSGPGTSPRSGRSRPPDIRLAARDRGCQCPDRPRRRHRLPRRCRHRRRLGLRPDILRSRRSGSGHRPSRRHP